MKLISELPDPIPPSQLLVVPRNSETSDKLPASLKKKHLALAMFTSTTKIELPAPPTEIILAADLYDSIITPTNIMQFLAEQNRLEQTTILTKFPEKFLTAKPETPPTPLPATPIDKLSQTQLVELAKSLQQPIEGDKETLIKHIAEGFHEESGKVYNQKTGRWIQANSNVARQIIREQAVARHKEKPPTLFFPQPYEAYSWQSSGEITSTTGETWTLPNSRGFPTFLQKRFPLLTAAPTLSTTEALHSHQQIVKDYLHPTTPYRSILAYHGLGGGKTRLAIEIAEDFRDFNYKILIFTPASLQSNFRQEIRLWGRPDLRTPSPSTLTPEERIISNSKIDRFYHFINYNGTPLKTLKQLNIYYDQLTNTYFPPENALIIIEEVHNLIHNMTSENSSKAKQILELLKRAKNCKFLAMSGTPMMESPLELVMLFNILRGPMFDPRTSQHRFFFPEDEERFREYFITTNQQGAQSLSNSARVEQFRRRILGLVSYYPGGNEVKPRQLYPEIIATLPTTVTPPDVILCSMGPRQLSEYQLVRQIEEARDKRARLANITQEMDQQAKPTFRLLSRRVSNFTFPIDIVRPLKGAILSDESITRFHLNTRLQTGDQSLWAPTLRQALLYGATLSDDESTLDDESRAEWDNLIYRLNRAKTQTDRTRLVEQVLATNLNKLVEKRQATPIVSALLDGDIKGWIHDAQHNRSTLTEHEAIIQSLNHLRAAPHVFSRESLADLSPKFLAMWDAIRTGPKPILIYSNFKTMEGVGIFSIYLEHMGYSAFNARDWVHTETSLIPDAPRYAFYTGDTDSTSQIDERQYILNTFNHPSNQEPITERQWPTSKMSPSDNRGSKIQIILGTAAVAEGLNIKGVRQLLIMEPHWNMVRIEQVIGRTKRYKSHEHLPVADRTVTAKMFISIDPKFSHDIPKWMAEKKMTPVEFSERTREITDLYIYNVALRKKQLSDQLLALIQQTAIDCRDSCLKFAAHDHKLNSYYPDYLEDPLELPNPKLLPAHETYLPFLPSNPQPALLNPDGSAKYYYKKSELDSGQIQMRLYRLDGAHYRSTPFLVEQPSPGTFRLIRG